MRAGDLIVEGVVAFDGGGIGEEESAGGEGEGALDGRALERAAGAEEDVAADLYNIIESDCKIFNDSNILLS